MKFVSASLPWTDTISWAFPDDENRLSTRFMDGPKDLLLAVPMLMGVLTGTRSCIQAGGCVGLWPLYLSRIFNKVYTFEPEMENFRCLIKNINGAQNIYPINAALGLGDGVELKRAEGEIGNCGAHYVVPGDDMEAYRIDNFDLSDVDLIYLDVEGAESDAIYGAANTIKKCKPVIGVENKGLNAKLKKKNVVDVLVNEFNYKVHGKPYRLDTILVPR